MNVYWLVVAALLFAFAWRKERRSLWLSSILLSERGSSDLQLNKSELNKTDANVRIYQQPSELPSQSPIDIDNPEAEREANEAARPKPKLIRSLGLGLFVVAVLLVGSYVVLERLSEVPITPVVTIAGASVTRGHEFILDYGCGGCHVIPGVIGAVSHVGPNLTSYGNRSYIAGYYSNTPDMLIRWLQNPQQLRPGSAMPNLGVSATEARDIAAYLYQLR